ncbi:MAG: DUF456 domain-containing protein [Phycisphaerae bacterium]
MQYVWATGLVLANAVWLALDLFGLPGNWLMVASTVVVAWINWSRHSFSIWTLAVIVVLATIGEALELIAGMVGARKAGASKRGALGALGGGFVGAVFGTVFLPIPVLGSLAGAVLGACAGAWGIEMMLGRGMKASVKSGIGSGVGQLVGTTTKLTLGVIIWLIVAVAAYWP